MNLDSTQRELFRNALLRVLAANGTRFGLTPAALAAQVVRFGFRPSAEEVAEEVAYLADKALVTEMRKVLSPENRAWRITADGRDHLALND